MFSTQEKTVAAIRVIGQMENSQLLRECNVIMNQAKNKRSLDSMLALPFGSLSNTEYNPVVQAFIEELTEAKTLEKHDSRSKRKNYQSEAMECIRAARHTHYVSPAHVAF